MNREEALEYMTGYDRWPKTDYPLRPTSPEDWTWVDVDGQCVLTHSMHDPINYSDWAQAFDLGLTSTPTAEPDMVNHPPHYQSDNGIECIDAIRAALGRDGFIAYCRGNAIKYLWRDKANNVEDRNKAVWYINRANAEETRG